MNNSDFFVNPLKPLHFLSVFSYINTLSDVFYSENLLTIQDQFKPIPIVNSLCEYLHKNNESTETKMLLSHILLLKGSDLYGSKENETVDLDYANAMIDHIIGSIVFSKYINSFGYLAALVNSTNNLTLSFFKQKVVKDLKSAKYLNEDGSVSNMSELTVKWVTEKLIFPLFPQPEYDLKIIDVDYIYAQAGLILARSARINPHNISFDEFIAISQSIEEAVLQGQIDKSALKIFELPALLYFAHKKKEFFRKEKIVNIISSEHFWTDAFNLLFSDLNVTYEKITKLQEENPAYQFNLALSGYKNRTKLAEDTLRNLCPLENESDYTTEVKEYKYYNSNWYCKKDNRLLPDINKLYSEQNKKIADKFFLLEKALIRKAFDENLTKLIDSQNVTIFPLKVRSTPVGTRHSLNQKVNYSTDIFLIRINKIPHIYALIRNENNISLLSAEPDMELFVQKLGLKKGSNFVIPSPSKPIKDSSQTFENFTTNIAKPRAEHFQNQLDLHGYEATTGEKVIEVLKQFIPFYPCKEAYERGRTEEIAFTCMLDLFAVIPFAGEFINIGFKLTNAGLKSLLIGASTNIKTAVLRTSISLALKSGIRVISGEVAKEFSKIITLELFKDVAIATFRLLDPGLEFAYILGKSAVKAIHNLFSIIGKKVPSLSRVLQSFKNVKQKVEVTPKQVGLFNDHKIYVNSISGVDGYGCKYILLPEGKVEFRRVLGYKSEQLVTVIRVTKKGRIIYKKFDLKTAETYGPEMEIRNDILQMVIPSLAVRLKMIKVIGLNGGGKLPSERLADQNAMLERREEAVSLVVRYSQISEDLARETLSQYVLEETKSPVKFAEGWIIFGEVPEWSKVLKLVDRKIFESLRYDAHLEDLHLTEEVAVKRINEFYGENYVKDVTQSDPSILFQIYSGNLLHSSVTFEDYYAITNWVGSGYTRIMFANPEAWRMQSAFYRLALRQADDSAELLSRVLYRGESRMDLNLVSLSEGQIYEFNRFVSFSEDSDISKGFLNLEGGWATEIFYELTLDSPFLAANIYRVFPTPQKEAVILPEVKFLIEKVEHLMMEGCLVVKVHMKNLPVSKPEWLAQLTNNIKLRQDWEDQFFTQSVINDFDVSLLN